MKNRSKQLLFFLLAAFAVAALVSCSGKSSGSAANAGQSGLGSREAQPVPAGDWQQPYATTVHLTAVKTEGNDIVYENGDDYTNNPWTRAWKEKLNIQVTYDWNDAGGIQYDTKINMAIASGTLPDVFRCNYNQFRQLMTAGLLQDITEPYQKYASQRIRDYELTDPDTIKTVTVDGRIYGVPNYYYGVIDQPRDLWVRKDWYEAAGKPEIKTVADFERLARTFMSAHGGYGIASSNTLEELFMTGPMFNVYLGNPTANNDFWYKDATGRIRAGISHPEAKVALTYWAKWFKEGILNPDFASTDYNKMLEDIVNGKTGMEPYWQWQGWHAGPNLVAATGSDNAYMIPLPFPTVDGSQVMGQVGFPNSNIFVVSKSCANPAAFMKLLSYTDKIMFDPNTVLTDEEFRAYTDGQREHTPQPFEIIDPSADMLQFVHVLHALKTGDTSELFTSGMKKKYSDSIAWLEKRDSGGLGAYLQQGFDGCAYDRSKFLLDNNFIVKTDMWGAPPVDFEKTVNAFDVVVQGFTKIILGQEPVSSYDKIIAEWYANGGQIMEEAVNRDYNK
jgi:putative aldouronate transport system substrate-binding protein